MIKYITIPDKKMTIAILDNTRYDAIRRINKFCKNSNIGVYDKNDKYLMANRYSATVVCHDPDKYDVEEGKRIAKKKCLANYHKAMDARLDKFFWDIQNLWADVFEKNFFN